MFSMPMKRADDTERIQPVRKQRVALCSVCGVILYTLIGKDPAGQPIIRPTLFYHVRRCGDEAQLVCQNCESVFPAKTAKLADGREAFMLRIR
jgi:hypothetical protein